MLSFKELRESSRKKMPTGKHVYSKTINKHKVMIHKDTKGFVVYIDGDKLDTYRSQREAEKAGVAFAKEF